MKYFKIEYLNLILGLALLYVFLIKYEKPVITDAPTVQTDTVAFKDGVISFKLNEMKQGVVRELHSDKLDKDLRGKQFSIDSSSKNYNGLSAYVVLYESKDELKILKDFIN